MHENDINKKKIYSLRFNQVSFLLAKVKKIDLSCNGRVSFEIMSKTTKHRQHLVLLVRIFFSINVLECFYERSFFFTRHLFGDTF